MEMSDKAVSTEDLITEPWHNVSLEVARLDAVLNTLVEKKVDSIKNDKMKERKLVSSPKRHTYRLRITSSSSTSFKDNRGSYSSQSSLHRKHHRQRHKYKEGKLDKTTSRKLHKSSGSIMEKSIRKIEKYHKRPRHLSDDEMDETSQFLGHTNYFSANQYITVGPSTHSCCCINENNGHIIMHYDEDYISLKIDECGSIIEDVMISHEDQKKMRRKRRRQQKKRMKRHIAISPLPTITAVKEIDPEELPRRARWTIVATACLLLFMCLLLIGVTLRMAPIIDDMVRKENEELMNSLNRETAIPPNYNLSSLSSVT